MVRKNIVWAMALLTLATGSLDVTAFLRLGGVFASVMTSNLVFVGIAHDESRGPAGRSLRRGSGQLHRGRGCRDSVAKRGAEAGRPGSRGHANFVLGGEFLLLLAYALWWMAAGAHPKGWDQVVLLAAVALAMGAQGVAARVWAALTQPRPTSAAL